MTLQPQPSALNPPPKRHEWRKKVKMSCLAFAMGHVYWKCHRCGMRWKQKIHNMQAVGDPPPEDGCK